MQSEHQQNDQFIVINDTKNVPYGDKSADQIYRLTKAAILPLIDRCDVIVIACNTATACAIDRLRDDFSEQKFVGFEPMIKPAAFETSTGKIAVLATGATLKSQRYQDLKAQWASDYEVFEPDCSTWARKIEDGAFADNDLRDVVELIARENIDQVILACTHYLGIEEQLRRVLAKRVEATVQILQPIEAINAQIDRVLGSRMR